MTHYHNLKVGDRYQLGHKVATITAVTPERIAYSVTGKGKGVCFNAELSVGAFIASAVNSVALGATFISAN